MDIALGTGVAVSVAPLPDKTGKIWATNHHHQLPEGIPENETYTEYWDKHEKQNIRVEIINGTVLECCLDHGLSVDSV